VIDMTWILLAQDAGGGFAMFVPFIAMFAILYFLMIRPQMKQQKQHDEFLSKLKAGDDVVTRSGLLGKIVEIKEDKSNIVVLDLGDSGQKIKVRVLKNQIAANSVMLEKSAK
jgi:preprotein translocase subunit YajC